MTLCSGEGRSVGVQWVCIRPAGGPYASLRDFIAAFVPRTNVGNEMVPQAGLEPACLAALDFESSASTISPLGHSSLAVAGA
jgi:hypothetical protein